MEFQSLFRPIFIVHDADSKISAQTAEAVCHQRKNMEINNNENSPYLHEREDKSDNLIPSVQCASDKGTCAAKSDERGCAKSPCIWLEAKVNETIKSSRSDSDKGMSMSSKGDTDECAKSLLNERTMEPDEERQRAAFTQRIDDESAKSVINNEMTIKSDSERLDVKEISSNDQNTLIASRDDDDAGKMRQSKNDDDGES
jgi:hypothetical protein